MVSPKVPSLRIIKDFFALLRKEYSYRVTEKTTAKEISQVIRRRQEITRRLTDEQKSLIKRWNYQPEMVNRSIELKGSVVYSKSKTDREYVRLNIPWKDEKGEYIRPQVEFIKKNIHMPDEQLWQSFNRRFGGTDDAGMVIEMRSLSSIRTMKSRIKTGKVSI